MEGFFQNHDQDEVGHADGVHAHAGPKQACCDSHSEGHREFDDPEWIARLTSHIPERDALTVS